MRRFKIEPELRDRIKAVAAAEERPPGHWMAIALDMMSRRGVPGLPAGQALTDGDLMTVGVQIDDDTADRIKAAAAADRRLCRPGAGGRCAGPRPRPKPRRQARPDMFEIDHVVPQSKGGASTLDNLQLLCSPCNKSKGNKTMAEWEAEKSAA